MNKGKKKTTQRIPVIIANKRFNNEKITLKGVVTKEKKKLWGIKRIYERYELKQSSTYNMQP
jgi:predicted NUDIX family phosphoesterase